MSDDTIKLVGEINAKIDGIKTESQKINEAVKASVDATKDEAKAALKVAEESASKVAAMSESIVAMEQKLADKVKNGSAAPESLGHSVIKSEAFKIFAAGASPKFVQRIEANTITGQTGSPAANSDTLVGADRLAGIIDGAYRTLSILDFLPQGTTNSNNIEYAKELAFTNSAAETAEGDTKPQSSLTYTLVNAPIRTIAHWLKVSKQVLEDSAQLQSHIDSRLRYGARLRYEQQIVAGNGTNQNISGMTDGGNYTAFVAESDENILDGINRMIEECRIAEYEPDIIMLNPRDWHEIERTKVGTGDARYVIGDPSSVLSPVLWGKPVIVSNSIPENSGLVGAVRLAYQVWNRSGVVVEMFEQDDTNVQKNLITVRAELRGTLATYLPAAVQFGPLQVV